ncbi:MAG: 2-(1,2-epoxy-1,2-dihydrophenyl)acetyl-CoA isomerase [Ectothiorhodospiraceae bacterium]|nr:2-(1,2-epoxy-1,2-dihydrophenyl)acetyl-CoA isomerase [Ectothiorhodospiraceae bacterium]
MSFETILFEKQDGILTITLNRPDVLNAFNEQMTADLQEAFNRAAEDDDVRVIVLTGAGRAFCSGQDLKDISDDETRSLADSLKRRYNPLIRAMRSLPKPIIAAINGACAGAGLSLALACDMRFAADNAKLIEVFIRIGLVPDSGSSWFLPHLIGYAKAFELCATGRDVRAPEAEQIGLVNKVVNKDLLMEYTMSEAKKFAAAPTQAIGQIKEMLNRAVSSDLDTALQFEEEMQEKAGFSYDYKEGKKAFLEKRPPKFEGR